MSATSLGRGSTTTSPTPSRSRIGLGRVLVLGVDVRDGRGGLVEGSGVAHHAPPRRRAAAGPVRVAGLRRDPMSRSGPGPVARTPGRGLAGKGTKPGHHVLDVGGRRAEDRLAFVVPEGRRAHRQGPEDRRPAAMARTKRPMPASSSPGTASGRARRSDGVEPGLPDELVPEQAGQVGLALAASLPGTARRPRRPAPARRPGSGARRRPRGRRGCRPPGGPRAPPAPPTARRRPRRARRCRRSSTSPTTSVPAARRTPRS